MIRHVVYFFFSLNVLNELQYETDSWGDTWEERLPTVYGLPWIEQILIECVIALYSTL